jgi:hypothetical protein
MYIGRHALVLSLQNDNDRTYNSGTVCDNYYSRDFCVPVPYPPYKWTFSIVSWKWGGERGAYITKHRGEGGDVIWGILLGMKAERHNFKCIENFLQASKRSTNSIEEKWKHFLKEIDKPSKTVPRSTTFRSQSVNLCKSEPERGRQDQEKTKEAS